MIRVSLFVLFLSIGAVSAAQAAAPTPEQPLLLSGDESVATADGAAALHFNPACLGLRYPAELLLSSTGIEPQQQLDRGALSLGGFGLFAARYRDRYQHYGFGFAGGRDALRLGVTSHWVVSRFTNHRTTNQRLGALSRPAPWCSFGVVADNLTQPELDGNRFRRTWTGGVGLRPLALSRPVAHTWGTRLTLTADVVHPEGGDRTQARLRFGGEIEALPGVVLRGAVEDHGAYHVGVSLLGPRWGYHASADHATRGALRDVSHTLSLHAGEDRSVLASRAERRVAVVRLAGHLGDEALGGFSLLGGGGGDTPAGPIHRQLERALEDPLTRGVLLELRGVSGMAQLEELRPRIRRLREAGKPVVALLEYGGERGDLYLAAACDRVVVAEEAMFLGLGLRAERRYYRDFLAGIGIRVERSSYGAYKSAYRRFSADSTPPADREAIEHDLDQYQEILVSTVTADRRMPRERLLTLLDGRQWPAAELVKAGLADSVGYREDALRVLGRLAGLGEKPRLVSLARRYAARREWAIPARVAVVYAGGGIEAGRSGNDLLNGATLGSETLTRQLERAFKDDAVRGVVLRIESPGGSGVASNLIDHALQRLKRETKKPLIVSMGSVAASGGYYISTHADRIYADRFTVTGSIGVLTIKPSLEGWYAKHRVRQDDFERGAYMRGWSMGRDWDAAAQVSADSAIGRYYRGFVAKVAEGRGLSTDSVDAVAQGRVWLGEDALARGLVDEIGGLEAAVAEARRRGHVPAGEKIRLAEYRRPQPALLARLLTQQASAAWERYARLPDFDQVYYLTEEPLVP